MGLKVLVIGGENHHLRIPMLLALRKLGFDVAAAGNCSPTPFTDAGIEFHTYSLDRFVNSFSDAISVRGIAKAVSRAQADVVQTFDTKPAILVPLAARWAGGSKVVRTINGLGWLYSSKSKSAMILRPTYELLCRLTAPLTARTVFQNEDDMAFFERKGLLGKGGGCLIPGSGIDVGEFRRQMLTEASRSELRNNLGLGDAEVVVTVARLNRIKGIPVLLEAAGIVHAARPGVRFLIVGPRESEGPFAVTDAELSEHAPYVHAIGSRSDIPALLSIADVFAFPTELREGVPRVLLEAAAAELPIVTTKMPGCVDIVKDNITGLLTEPGEPHAFANRILECLSDKQRSQRMASSARQLVEQQYSLDLTVDRYAAVYREVTALQLPVAERAAS